MQILSRGGRYCFSRRISRPMRSMINHATSDKRKKLTSVLFQNGNNAYTVKGTALGTSGPLRVFPCPGDAVLADVGCPERTW